MAAATATECVASDPDVHVERGRHRSPTVVSISAPFANRGARERLNFHILVEQKRLGMEAADRDEETRTAGEDQMQELVSIDIHDLIRVVGGADPGTSQPQPKEPDRQSDRDTVSGNGNVTIEGIGALTGAYTHSQSDRNACIWLMRDTLCGPRRHGGGSLAGPAITLQPSPEECANALNIACGEPPGGPPLRSLLK